MPQIHDIPTYPYLSGSCQRFSNIGAHGAVARLRGRIAFGLGLRALANRVLGRPVATPPPGLGEPSAFAEGSLVRVRPESEIRARLDARSRTRGLEFGRQQWPSCGQVYRVTKVVRRIIDDGGVYRRVSRTVLLEGVHCDSLGESTGCGRECPMMYRDEWLESVDINAASQRHIQANISVYSEISARVRSVEEIQATLDALGRRGNLLFMPEMAALAGREIRVSTRLGRVFEFGRWVDTDEEYFLSRAHVCSGAILGRLGPCDRQCLMVWHRDWLRFD